MACPACGGELEAGFIPDFGHHATWVAVWVAGEPDTKKSFWEAFRTGGGVGVEGMDVKAIEARRCRRCGRLELYAKAPALKGMTPAAR